jgi:hypothetical protein
MKFTQRMTMHLNGGRKFSELHYAILADGKPTNLKRGDPDERPPEVPQDPGRDLGYHEARRSRRRVRRPGDQRCRAARVVRGEREADRLTPARAGG